MEKESLGKIAVLAALVLDRARNCSVVEQLGWREIFALELLALEPGMTIGEVGRGLGDLAASSVMQLGKKLNDLGLVEDDPAAKSTDKRKRQLVLSEKGKRALEKEHRLAAGWIARFLERFSDEEQVHFEKAAEALGKGVERYLNLYLFDRLPN